ncbi:MAG: hypothetical protein RL563_825 [Pseudomonadota bacterium]
MLADIEDYRLRLEQKIRETTQIPVRIGHLSAGMRGFNPEVLLDDISVEALDANRPPAIELQEVRIGLDVLDLILTRDWLSSSRITLVGAKIDVIRTTDGRLLIKGLQASDEQPTWLLQGGKYELLRSQISWLDLQRGKEPVHFHNLDVLLKNHYFDGSHEIHLVSKLPREYGESLRISARVSGDLFAARNIEGQLYVEAVDLQAPALLADVLPLDLKIHAGEGDLRIWSQWRDSKPYQIAGYIQAQQVALQRDGGKTLPLDTFEGNFVWSQNSQSWRLAAYDLNIVAQHQRWPSGEFYLQQTDQGDLGVLVSRLDLPALMYLSALIQPQDNDYASWLALNPEGHLRDVHVYATRDFQHYALSGHFDDVGIAHYQTIPELRHLSGGISANDRYGVIRLDSEQVTMNAPDWFRQSLDLSRVAGRLHWWHADDAWQFYSNDLALNTGDFKTLSDLNLLLPKEASPVMDWRMAFGEFGDINQVSRYLPAKIMDQDAVAWLDDAFVAGHIDQGAIQITGNLANFPFENGEGLFETVFAIEQGEIQFNEDWPHLQNVYADVQFIGQDLRVSILEGKSEQVDIEHALVTISDVANGDHVQVWGKLHSELMNSLSFLQKTPIRSRVAGLFGLLDGHGNVPIDLDLMIPYEVNDPVNVKVTAHLQQTRLLLTPIALRFDGLDGDLLFTQEGVFSEKLGANTLGQPIQASLNSDAQATYLHVEGGASVEALTKQFAFLKNEIATGSLNYAAHLTLPHESNQAGRLNIQSNLKGLGINTNDFLGKRADQEIPLSLDFQFDNDRKLPLKLQYGEHLNAALLIDKDHDRLHSGHILLGHGFAQLYEPAGLKLEIQQASLNLSKAIGAFRAQQHESRWPELHELQIDTGQVLWQERDYGPFQCRLQRSNNAWQGELDSRMAKGWLSVPDDLASNQRIQLRMAHLNLSAMEGLDFKEADEVVTELPLIDIDSQQLLWRNVNLGHLHLQTERLLNGIHFKKVQLRGARSKIDFSADWLKQAQGTVSQLNGSLTMKGFGSFLSELGFTDEIKETTADIRFNGGWRGAPYDFELSRLNGQLSLDLREGRIASIEPGFGRLLGLIAMEQWVKRLSLDFSDVYRQGLAFDQVKGHFKIKDGLAYTDDLTIDAVAATFNIAGFANLANKTLDQRVAVVPKSSGAVPIAGTIVDGIASLITKAVTDDYQEGYFFGSKYQLSGAWGDVAVTPLSEEDGLISKTWRGLTDFSWMEKIVE